MAKRGAGEGHLGKLKDGRWRGALMVGRRADGKPDVRYVYARTRAEARAKLDLLREQHRKHQLPPAGRLTVGEWLIRWLGQVELERRRRTAESYAERVRLYLAPALGATALTSLAPEDVEGLVAAMRERGLSPRTIQYTRDVLRIALNVAVARGLIWRNVASLVAVPRAARRPAEPLTLDEVRRLRVTLRGHRWEALFLVAFALGLRQGEGLGLRWQDVDVERAELHTRVELVLGKGGEFRLEETKTHKSARPLPLPRFARDALVRRRELQRDEERRAGARWRGNPWGLVFTTRVGTPINRRSLTRTWHRLLADAGLARARYQDLRHTCASLLFAEGIDPRTIMDLLGHRQLSTTMDLYTHLFRAVRRSAADTIDDLLAD